jgi:hypothetical protein
MTSQKVEKTDERMKLEAVAREMGMKGRFPTDDDALEAKIAEAQTTEAVVVEKVEPVKEAPVLKRKPAPRMIVAGNYRDDRTAMVEKLEREDPDSKYIMQSGTISNRELAAKGFERTDFTVKNDIVIRTNREDYDANLNNLNETSYEAMGRIDGGTGIVGKHEAHAKVAPK